MRPDWGDLPLLVRDAVEELLGFPVVRAASQPGGFSPGVAARVWGPAGEGAFVKVASGEANAFTTYLHRNEARYAALLPAGHPSPRLLGSWDDGTWVALAFEQVDGRQPGLPWTAPDVDVAVGLLDAQAQVCAPSELPDVRDVLREELNGFRLLAADPEGLGGWEGRHLRRLAELESGWEEAAQGDRWLHNDTRGDNMLVLPDGTGLLVDWPWSARGNPAFDALAFVPAAVRDGALGAVPCGTAVHDAPWQLVGDACEQLFQRLAGSRLASADGVTSMLAAFAGLMQHRSRQPAPPSMPTVRAFQATQGAVALAWLRVRTGWD